MNRLYLSLLAIIIFTSFLDAQVTTERCFHLDKVQFLQHRQDFWLSHTLYSTASAPMALITPGYYNLTEGTYAWGLGIVSLPFTHHFAGVTTVNGWKFGNGLALGLGVGYHAYNEGWLLPIYVDGRFFIGKQRVKFFVMGDGGILYDFQHPNERLRIFGNPGAGIVVPLAQNMRLSFSTGLFSQWTNFFDRRDSYVNMKLGLMFGK